jgi:PAT family beta-lactamase induction signal transducer AmpG
MNTWAQALRVYGNPRLLAILAMGFASGLPLALTGATLQVWLAEAHVSLVDIGLFALVGIAYSVKFVWSPLIDRMPLPWLTARLGQRRSWSIAIQLALACAIAALGASDPVSDVWRTAALAALVAFLSASQDIVIDAYRIELLDADEQGAGAAATQWGYRFGVIASGAGAMALAELFGWPRAYLVMASLVGVGLVTVLLTPEPAHPREREAHSARSFLREAVLRPFAEFSSRPRWGVILLFVVLYRFGDALAGGMSSAFYVQLGFSKLEIASVVKIFGVLATMAGIAAGGALVFRSGIPRALLGAGVFAALSNFAFTALAYAGHDLTALGAVVAVENFTSGLVSAAFVAYLSELCNAEFTATQYALLSSLAATGRTVLASSAGWLAELLGWPLFFAATALAALPGLWLALSLAGLAIRADASSPLPCRPIAAACGRERRSE